MRQGNRNKYTGKQGFTLVELVVVIGVIGIITTIASLNFNKWQVKSLVEAQIKQMATDINELRILALTTKQRHSIVLNASSYELKRYSSATYTSATDLATKGTSLATKTVKYRLITGASTLNTTVLTSAYPIEINERGMLVDLPVTIHLATGAAISEASINCLTVHTIRVNVGKQNLTTGACDDK